MHMHMISY